MSLSTLTESGISENGLMYMHTTILGQHTCFKLRRKCFVWLFVFWLFFSFKYFGKWISPFSVFDWAFSSRRSCFKCQNIYFKTCGCFFYLVWCNIWANFITYTCMSENYMLKSLTNNRICINTNHILFLSSEILFIYLFILM